MDEAADSRWAKAWPQVRAVLVLLHVVAVTLMALPAPGGGMNRAAWAEPTVQGEFAAWTERLNGLGIDVTSEQLQDRAWAFAVGFMDLRETVLTPFEPYYEYTGTWQSWRMFVAPHRVPSRLEIDLERVDGAGWQPIYVQASDDLRWRADQLEHDRLRAQIFRLSWPGYESTYGRFAEWLARQAARDFPDGTRLRVRFFEYRTLSPEDVRAGVAVTGTYEQTKILTLSRYR